MTPDSDRRGAGSSSSRPVLLPVLSLISVLAVVAAGTGWVGWLWIGDQADVGARLLVPLALLAGIGVLLRERALGPHLGISVATVVLAATIPLAGPHGAVLVGLFAYLVDFRQRYWRPWIFNAVMAAAVGGLGGLTYVALGGLVGVTGDPGGWKLLERVGLPLFLAYVMMTVANAWAVGAMSAAVRGTRVLDVTRQALRGVGWSYLSHVVIGFLFVVLWGPARLNALAGLFILGPLVIAHWTIGREALARREHQELVTTFVAALEQSDVSTAGHSARVADLAETLGGEMGLGGRAAEELRYAALLHDIGLVAARTLGPTEDDDEDSYLTGLSAHPEAGVLVLRGLDFLAGALPGIAHHHERFDGRGYPAGLAGTEIPQAARIIAVADAFDALTVSPAGPRMTSPEALAQLQARAGSQLDPDVVTALRALHARSRRLLTPEAARPAPTSPVRPQLDHDLPEVSDAFARWQPETLRHLS